MAVKTVPSPKVAEVAKSASTLLPRTATWRCPQAQLGRRRRDNSRWPGRGASSCQSISAARAQAAANLLHVAAAYWLSIDGTDRHTDTRPLQYTLRATAYYAPSVSSGNGRSYLVLFYRTLWVSVCDACEHFYWWSFSTRVVLFWVNFTGFMLSLFLSSSSGLSITESLCV